MTEELFDSISTQLERSGVTVARKLGGDIIVSLPDSDETLAVCTDNGDGTMSYTMRLGDGTEDAGSGTPEEFRDRVLEALDSWIDYVPYDKDAVEPHVSTEYRRSIGESRESAIRNSLFEMGLDDDQADAIMEAVGILYESSIVSVTINGKQVSGSSVNDIAMNKANRPFLKRQWVLSQFRKLGKTPSGKLLSTDELINELGIEPPTDDDIVGFVKEHLGTMQEERTHTDDELLGTAWNKFGKSKKDLERSSLTAGRANDSDDKTDEVMANESRIKSGEKGDYDEEIGTAETHTNPNEDHAPVSKKEASEKYGIDLDEKNAIDVSGKNDLKSMWDGDASTLGQVDAFGARNGGESVLEEEDRGSEYDIPEKAVAGVIAEAEKFKESLGDILQSIPSFGKLPAGFVLRMMFGRPGAGLGGAVNDLYTGNQHALHKIEDGDGLLDASKATPDQRNQLEKALRTEVVRSAIKRVQDGFGDLADYIEEIIPAAYDEARGIEPDGEGSVRGRVDEVPADFINLFRTILYNKGVPFAGYPWSVVEKMCSKLSTILKLGKPVAGGRKVSGAPVGTRAAVGEEA